MTAAFGKYGSLQPTVVTPSVDVGISVAESAHEVRAKSVMFQHATLFGIPLPIVAVLWPPFPLFVAIGALYTHRAEALEDAFRELVEPPR